MSPDSVTAGSVRSADELNAAIRALWSHPQVPLTDGQRAEYARLCAELRQVERGNVVEAA
ncbi:hypothetical protein ACH5A7_20750 [Streptomyces sp. NPDC018955]|uniref:hypothetical protein n=1 Tax=Streptomyces sp. NPDC018955 TaxID=3365055 RepID=UPI0037A40340